MGGGDAKVVELMAAAAMAVERAVAIAVDSKVGAAKFVEAMAAAEMAVEKAVEKAVESNLERCGSHCSTRGGSNCGHII